MRRNRKKALTASLILSMILALSAPMMAAGAGTSDLAALGDTGINEDAQYSDDEGLSGDDGTGDEGVEGDLPEEPVKTYTVTYSMNGHGESYEEEVEEGSTATEWTFYPEADGYNFTGWYTDKGCDKAWDPASPITGDTKVYAGWEKIQEEEPEQTEDTEDDKSEQSGSGTGSSAVENSKDEEEKTAEDSSREADNGDSGTTGNTTSSSTSSAASSSTSSTTSSSANNTASSSASSTSSSASGTTDSPTSSTTSSSGGSTATASSGGSSTTSSSSGGTTSSSSGGTTTSSSGGSTTGAAAEEEIDPTITDSENWSIIVEPSTIKYPASCKVNRETNNDETADRGVTLTVEGPENAVIESWQWYAIREKTEYKLKGTTATEETLFMPSVDQKTDDYDYACVVKVKGVEKTITVKKDDLKVTDDKQTALYIGNYVLTPGESINLTTVAPELGSGIIEFSRDEKTIIFHSVNFDNSRKPRFDHVLSPASGILLSIRGKVKDSYTIQLDGDSTINIGDTSSIKDTSGSALRIECEDSKETPDVVIEGDGSLNTVSGKTAISCDGNLVLETSVKILPAVDDTVSNGIECESLTLKKDALLQIKAHGTGIYTHDSLNLESGSKTVMEIPASNKPLKKAAVFSEGDITIDGASLSITDKAVEDVTISSFNGIESEGKLTITDSSNVAVTMTTPETAYGIKTEKAVSLKDSTLIVKTEASKTAYGIKTDDAFVLTDSNLGVKTTSSDSKGKTFGVLCGSASVTLSKEKKYTAYSIAEEGIAFAAYTGKNGSTKKGYQEDYTPEKIKYVTTEVMTPSSNQISIGSIEKDSSGYDYIEAVYNKKNTAAPSTGIQFESTNHEWGDPEYTWSTDYKSVTAKVTCKNYAQHVLTETVATTSKVSKAATCEVKGETTYTAAFKNSAFKEQTKTVANIAALGHKFGEWTVTKRPTLKATGTRQHTCERCKAVKTEVIPVLEKGTYKIKTGSTLSWTKGSGKTLTVKVVRETKNDTAFSHFQGILVDGKVLNKKYYTAKSGSVVITFKSDFLSKLAVGSHTLTYGFEDADNPSSKLTIQSATSSSSSSSSSKGSSSTSGSSAKGAATGDYTNILLWVLLLGVSAVAVILILRARGKKDKGGDQNSSEKK